MISVLEQAIHETLTKFPAIKVVQSRAPKMAFTDIFKGNHLPRTIRRQLSLSKEEDSE
jgi:hypothetical protein